jgi:benzil reductase ((S)-benzoin forming)
MTSVNANEASAIVTGHSRGLGAAIAEHLLARGARVLGLSRHGNPSLATRFPEKLEQQVLDVADFAALQRWLNSGAVGSAPKPSRTPWP